MKQKKPKVRTELVNKTLLNWKGLTDNLTKLTQDELQSALDKELSGEKRVTFVSRLVARLARVKGKNELKKTLTNLR